MQREYISPTKEKYRDVAKNKTFSKSEILVKTANNALICFISYLYVWH